ncbi:MAG: carboxypeptidase-like regulatory domain-containing protein [Dysgonomonas sp.]
MKLRLTILTLLTYFVIASGAQVKISGSIVDANTHNTVEFANVALLKNDSTFYAGASSDTLGLFAFNNIPKDNYILSATFVGYAKTYVPVQVNGTDVNIGAVSLATSDIMLKDVTVTGNAVIQKSDRKIIIPSDAQIKASNSGVTLLRNLQLSRIIINPISNAITLPGGDAVQLRINGVEVTIAEVVALQPEDIIRIEYHDEPGMRYGGAAGVIDYITRRKESGGSLSTNFTNVPYKLGYAEDYLSAKVNHKKSEFGINAYWHMRDLKWTRENKETFVFPDKVIERNEKGEPTKVKENSLNIAANYSLLDTDNYMFNATFRNRYDDEPNAFSNRKSTTYSSDGSTPLSILDESSARSNTPSLDLYFQKNLKNEQLLIFNIVGTYINTKSTRLYQERRENNLTTDIFSDVRGDKYSLITEGIYEKKIGQGKLSAGLKHTQSYTNNTYSGDVATDINLKFAETYGYAEYQLRKGKFNYTFGLGLMRTYNNQGENSNKKYIPRPTLRISYNINDNAYIRYNGLISGYSPSLSDLNNVEQKIDSLQIRRGNPNLETVTYYVNTLNAGYNKGMLGIEFYMRYSYDHKPIMEQITFENGKFVRTNINQKGFHRLYAETAIKLKPFKDYLTLSVTPGVNRFISYGESFTHTYTSWRVRGSVVATYKKWSLTAEVYSRWNSLWAETRDIGERIHIIMAGYKADKWSLNLGVLEPFSNSYSVGSRNLSTLAPNQSNVYTNKLNKIIMINFSLNLNFGRQYKAADKRLNNDDTDSGIMSGTKK